MFLKDFGYFNIWKGFTAPAIRFSLQPKVTWKKEILYFHYEVFQLFFFYDCLLRLNLKSLIFTQKPVFWINESSFRKKDFLISSHFWLDFEINDWSL